MVPWPLLLFALAVPVFIYFVVRAGRKRRAGLQAVAERLGLQFEPRTTEGLERSLNRLQALSEGSRPAVVNVLRGQYQGHDVRCFDFVATVRRGKQTETIRRGVAVLYLRAPLPRLLIAPENFLHKVAQVVGVSDIDFESDEFSRKFWVEAEDRKFAYDIVHPRMMEFLIERGPTSWEIRGNVLCHWTHGHFEPAEIEAGLDGLARFAGHIPDYVWSARVGA